MRSRPDSSRTSRRPTSPTGWTPRRPSATTASSSAPPAASTRRPSRTAPRPSAGTGSTPAIAAVTRAAATRSPPARCRPFGGAASAAPPRAALHALIGLPPGGGPPALDQVAEPVRLPSHPCTAQPPRLRLVAEYEHREASVPAVLDPHLGD